MPADEKLRQMIYVYLQSLAENPDLSSVLLFEHRSLDKKSHARHIPYRDRFESLWQDVLHEGVRAKLFACPDVGLAVRGSDGYFELDADMVSSRWTFIHRKDCGLLC